MTTKSFFTPDEFVARRARIIESIGSSACAFVCGEGPVAGFEVFRQTNDFFYLTGIDTPQAYLLIDGRNGTSTLFVPLCDEHAGSEGASLGAEDLQRLSGVDAVHSLDHLSPALANIETIFVPHSPAEGRLACQDTLRHAAKLIAADPWGAEPSKEQRTIYAICSSSPDASIRDLSPILTDMRLIKSPSEIEAMRHAGKICALGVREAIRSTEPGIYEYQLGGVADYVYRMNGVRSEGYRPIIAGGANIWFAHYYRNNCVLNDGDLVIMDYAPDVSNYTSDIGRMWPVNGRYSAVQRELYGFIVEYHKTLLRKIRPGVMPKQILAEAAEEMAAVIEKTAFSKEVYRQAALRTLTFEGHLSHTVGMAVHDGGRYFDRPTESGLVFALDPQMWIPEEKLYIRVEDTVAVTQDGVEVLTTGVPFELDEIEALMAKPGLIQDYPMGIAA